MALRTADFAGSWYPGNEKDCRKAIERFVGEDLSCPWRAESSLGGVVPHAGWVYSGKAACHVIKCLSGEAAPDLCLLFGRHLPPGGNRFIMKEGKWETPLGPIPIDEEVAEGLASEFPFNIETPEWHEQDNTIELQLPFLKYFFPDIKIVPVGLPPSESSLEIARRAASISTSAGRRTVVLGSTDLTHYGPNYGYTPEGTGREAVKWVKEENDKRIVELLVRMDGEGVIREALRSQNACCSGAAAACIAAVKSLGAKRGAKIDYYTSYDVHPGSNFVGYVGVLFGA